MARTQTFIFIVLDSEDKVEVQTDFDNFFIKKENVKTAMENIVAQGHRVLVQNGY